ncbi:MAG TPA: hypothetical protein VJM69_06250, partial [Dehalococcoidia bacterium]|nr:hypothetical protein [Dehalococcoidia bacterium]
EGRGVAQPSKAQEAEGLVAPEGDSVLHARPARARAPTQWDGPSRLAFIFNSGIIAAIGARGKVGE